MQATIRLTLALWLLLPPAVAGAADPLPDPMPAVRADHWADAAALAAAYADPVAQKLVTYYRLLAPGAATAPEIAAFVASSPDWPAQALLERRRQEAIAADPDDAAVLAQCAPSRAAGTLTPAGAATDAIPATTAVTLPAPITLPAARLRCADALANAGRNAQAAAEARRAWITGFADDPADFPQRWRAVLTPADQWERFQALAWTDPAAAARDLPLLDPAHRALAAARLALQHDAADAAALLAAVPRALAGDPALMLAQAGWLRRAERIPDAVALWRARGAAAQQAASPPDRAGFSPERERLARALVRNGDAADAYALVDDPRAILPRQAIDADFLAGFIALRLLHQPVAAARHFQALAAASPAAITQGRAWYWLGRAAAAQDPHAGDARADWARAAAFPTTFYGQLAAVALGDDAKALAARIDALRDPEGTRDQAFGLTQREVVRAAALLVAWGESRRAEAFLLRMDELAPDLPTRALNADLALYLGQPQTAVAIARRMGRDGLDAAAGRLAGAGRAAAGCGRSRRRARADPPGEQFRQRHRQPGRRARADAAYAGDRRDRGAHDRCDGDAGDAGVRSGREHAPGHRVSARAAGPLRWCAAAGAGRLQCRAGARRPVAGGEWRPARRAGHCGPWGHNRHGGLDRADPVRGNPQLRAARAGERGDLPRPPGRGDADPARAMGAVVHRISAWDGLALAVHEWDAGQRGDGGAQTPLLCLPGLVRTGEDFAEFSRAVGAGRRVVAPDYPGRGASGRSADVRRYAPEACLRDVLDLCAALHLHHVIAVGTSFGGLLAMGIAAARPTLLRGVVLNDVGPEIGIAGGDFVRRFIADDRALADLDACAAHLRVRLPHLSLETDAAWRRMAVLTYAQGADGRFRPNWDTAIARLMEAPPPPLWPLFDGLAHLPLLLVWGEASDILLPTTVAAMREARPDMAVVSLPGVGHAPSLGEPPVLRAIATFLERVG